MWDIRGSLSYMLIMGDIIRSLLGLPVVSICHILKQYDMMSSKIMGSISMERYNQQVEIK